MLLLTLALLATPDFPEVLQHQLDLPGQPHCTVCHATDSGGAGTVTTPFGVYLRSRGLRPGDEDSLRNALLADIGEKHSSNGGQTTDVEALKAGQNPNGGSLVPEHGCSSSAGAPCLLAALVCAAWMTVSAGRRSATTASGGSGRPRRRVEPRPAARRP